MKKIKKYNVIFVFLFLVSKSYSQLEAKANVLTSLVLIPNVGIEIQVGEKNSIQLDFLASFWNKLNNSKTPLHINQTFLEYRFYKKNDFSGLFVGTHVGYGMFTLKKPEFAVIYDPYNSSSKSNNSYQSGRVAFYGLTFGLKKRISKRISLEGFVGGGYSMANYKSFYEDVRTDIRDNWRTFNRSGEFVVYRGGIMIAYSFNPYKK